MKIIAHVNRKTVYTAIVLLNILLLLIIYSHLISGSFRNGLYFNVFGEYLPYLAYLLNIFSIYYLASMLWSNQGYLASDGLKLIEFKGSKINLDDIVDAKVTMSGIGLKNVTIIGKNRTINIRSHFLKEDAEYIAKIIKAEAKLL